MSKFIAYKNKAGVFIGYRRGKCAEVSIPAKTPNDWSRDTNFMDLPMMDKETFFEFTSALEQIKSIFEE